MIQKLGKYAIVEKLGEGAMGAVYKAYDEVLDRYVAVKTMAEDIKWDPELKLRFYREARSAASLHHPNIVTIHDLGEEGKLTYIVMELLQGQDLKDIIKDRVPLSFEQKLSIMAQVCDGLHHAHMNGIIHRDIKPGNIHVSPEGNVKLVDFGIARIPSSDLTRSGVRLGTPIYMSPEQIRGETYDERSDMFSAAIVFYELVTYVHPFRDKNIAKTLDNILFQNHFAFAEQCPEAPPELWPIIATALAKEPAKRFASMADFGRVCRNLQHELSVAAQKPGFEPAATVPRAPAETPQAPAAPSPSPQELQGRQLLQKGLSLLREERLEEAQADLRQAVDLLGQDEEAAQALAETERRMEGRRRASIAGHLEKARQAFSARRFPEAIASLNEIIRLDPRHAEAAEMRQRVLAEAEAERTRQARRAEGDREKAAGLAFLEQGKVPESLAALRRAADLLGDDPAVQQGLRDAEARERAEALRREVRAGLTETEGLLSAGELKRARERLGRVLELAPGEAEAANLLARLERAETEKRKAEEVSNLLYQSRDNLSRQDFEAAYARVRRALEIDPANPDAGGLLHSIDQAEKAKQRQDRIDQALAKGREALEHQDFASARGSCNDALALDPENAAANDLLRTIGESEQRKKTEEEIAQLLSQGQRAFLRNELDESESLARRALALDPEHKKVKDLLRHIGETRNERRQAEVSGLVARGRQALGQGDLAQAAELGQQAQQVDPDSVEAKSFLAAVGHARESRRQEEISGLLEQGRQSMERAEFEEASRQAEAVLSIDPQNSAARTLLGDIKRSSRAREKMMAKEKKRLEKEAKLREKEARKQEKQAGSAARDMDATVLLERPSSKGVPKAVIWAAVAAVVLIAVTLVIWKFPRTRPVQDPGSGLTEARANLDRGMFEEAISLAQQELSAHPDNAEAKALLEEARKGKTARAISTLLMEAQNYRAQDQLQESLDALARILELDPENENALAVKGQIEAQMAAAKSSEEQDAAVSDWLANASKLLAANKLAEARREIDKAAQVRPNAPGLAPIRRQLAARSADAARREKEQFELAQRQKQLEEWSGQAETLFRQGKYAAALGILDQWLAAEPQASRAQTLQHQTVQAQQALKAFDSAMNQKLYDDALRAAAQLEKINPADPAAGGMRTRATENKAAARATISVYRIAAPGQLLLDDEPAGSGGEMENKVVSAGKHKVTVEFGPGKQSSMSPDLIDGQKLTLVYDTAAMTLRPMVDSDRILLANRRIREEVHSYEAEHRHLSLFGGKCTGILRISGLRVEYQGSEHKLDTAFANIRFKGVNNDRVELETITPKQSWTFKVKDAAQALEIQVLWERLQKLGE